MARLMKMKYKEILLSGLILVSGLQGYGQFHQSIEVEGDYRPDVILRDRINVFPEVAEIKRDVTPLNYYDEGVIVDFAPELFTLPATGWRISRQFNRYPGYIDAGIGSWLNMNISAGYRFIDLPGKNLGVRFQHNSTSLWKPELNGVKFDSRQYRYDEAIGVFGQYNIGGKGSLSASLDYAPGFFNYYTAGILEELFHKSEDEAISQPSQTRNDVKFSLKWSNNPKTAISRSWNVGFDMRYFAYRRLYLPLEWNKEPAQGIRETDITLHGDFDLIKRDHKFFTLGTSLDMLFYSGKETAVEFADIDGYLLSDAIKRPDSYGILSLNPVYGGRFGEFNLRIGLKADFSANGGLKGNRYSLFHIAPDLAVVWHRNKFMTAATISGGSELTTMAALSQLDYYGTPYITNTRPVYTPFDGALHLKAGSFGGFEAALELRYKVSRGVPLGGWYMAWLDYGNRPMPGMHPVYPGLSQILYSTDTKGINLHGGRIKGELAYTYPGIVKIKGEIAWQPQNNKLGYFDGYDRPRVTAEASANVKPMKNLEIGINYKYRGVRRIYTREYLDPFIAGGVIDGKIEENLVNLRLPDLCLLGIEGSWSFSHDLRVWLRADNLLNRHDQYLPLQPLQGINFLVGASYVF